MKQKAKMMMLAIMVVPMMFLLTACGMTTEQVYNERIPMITIPEGEYVLVSAYQRNLGPNTEWETSGGIAGTETSVYIRANVFTFTVDLDGTGYQRIDSLYSADAFGRITLYGNILPGMSHVGQVMVVYSYNTITMSFVNDSNPNSTIAFVWIFERVTT